MNILKKSLKEINMKFDKTILITGGAGFIGSHVVRLFVTKYPNYRIINLDALTYAGNLENLRDIENAFNYEFVKGDIVDAPFIDELFLTYQFNSVIHLAAESHVDRSISDPMSFIKTNIIGTVNLLNAARETWKNASNTEGGQNPKSEIRNPKSTEGGLFYHVSTDEVYGSLGEEGFFTETTAYDPRSPYSASKASSDHIVRAYHHTYNLPVVISNCSNNYGPNHFPEKLIPLIISNIMNEKPLPVYGDGKYTRDWLWVKDHALAIDTIFHKGRNGETYNIGGNNEWKNIDLVEKLCDIMDEKLGRPQGQSKQLINFVKDRAGHDRRYAIDASKLTNELGWTPSVKFEEGFRMTIDWYLNNQDWVKKVTTGAYQNYYLKQYAER
jgi:dTDP-glucose 4,6-dehydratase